MPPEPPDVPSSAPPDPSTPRGHVRFAALDRPAVEVRHDDDSWYPGRLHAWLPGGDAVVSYLVTASLQHYRAVPVGAVRPRWPPA